MSTGNSINKSRVVLVAFIASLAIILSAISTVHINGADITVDNTKLPAMAEGFQGGGGGG